MPIRYLGPYDGKPKKIFFPQAPGGVAGGHFTKNGSFLGFSNFQFFFLKMAITRPIFDLGACVICHFVEQFKPEKLEKKISGFTEFSGSEFSKVCFGHFGPKVVLLILRISKLGHFWNPHDQAVLKQLSP